MDALGTAMPSRPMGRWAEVGTIPQSKWTFSLPSGAPVRPSSNAKLARRFEATGVEGTEMVRRIVIRGFKSVVEANIELGRLNVFVGANGAGKSVVLEAIGVLGAAADGRVDDASLLRRGVRPGTPALYKNAFAKDDIPRLITFNARSSDAEPVVYDLSLDNPIKKGGAWRFTHELLALERGGHLQKFVSRGPRGAKLWGTRGRQHSFRPADATRSVADTPNPLGEPPEAVREFLARLRGYAIFDPQTPVLRGIVAEKDPLDPIGIGGGRLAEALLETLRRNETKQLARDFLRLVGWVRRFGTARPSPEFVSPSIIQPRTMVAFVDRFMREGRNQLSAYDASEGALYVLMALILCTHPRAPKTLAIENVDHALHPRLARALIEVVTRVTKDFDRQVLLTTHNPLVLDGLDLSDDDVRLFTIDRDASGHTIVRRLVFNDAFQKAVDSGLSLSQMWVQGLIGAVPNIL